MPRRKSRFSPANAVHLVEVLIDEGKLAVHEIARYLKIAELKKRLQELRGGQKPAKRRKHPISAKRSASQKLQGRYIAYIRRFPKSARPQFQRIAKEQGRAKAVAAMKKQLASK